MSIVLQKQQVSVSRASGNALGAKARSAATTSRSKPFLPLNGCCENLFPVSISNCLFNRNHCFSSLCLFDSFVVHSSRLEAIAIRVEAIASRMEAIAIRLKPLSSSFRCFFLQQRNDNSSCAMEVFGLFGMVLPWYAPLQSDKRGFSVVVIIVVVVDHIILLLLQRFLVSQCSDHLNSLVLGL